MQSSGESSQESGKRDLAASVTERSSDLGTNMFILVRRFSTKVVVFWIWAAVEIRFREQRRVGTRLAWGVLDCVRGLEGRGGSNDFERYHAAHGYPHDVELPFRGPSDVAEDFEDVFGHFTRGVAHDGFVRTSHAWRWAVST
jgi:hypothetical protein